MGAPWSTSREKTYKKVKKSTRSLLLRHMSPYRRPSAAHHVVALDKDQSHFLNSRRHCYGISEPAGIKMFSMAAVQVKTEHLSMVRLCCSPSQQKCECIYGVFFHVQNSQNCCPKVTVVRRKWTHSPIFLLNSVASDYNGDSSDSIL